MHWVDFAPFFTRKTTFVTSCLLSSNQNLSEKGFTLKGNNLRASCFLLEQTPFEKEDKTILTESLPLKAYPLPLITGVVGKCEVNLFE